MRNEDMGSETYVTNFKSPFLLGHFRIKICSPASIFCSNQGDMFKNNAVLFILSGVALENFYSNQLLIGVCHNPVTTLKMVPTRIAYFEHII